MESFAEKIARVLDESVDIEPYNLQWPIVFELEKRHVLDCLPKDLLVRIEHFGSTAIPNLAAKPIIDILVEVKSLVRTKKEIVPILESQGYDYFWRPTAGDSTPPFYAWFIKRDKIGVRSHHIHMVEKDFIHWERLLFRDYLREHPELVREYQALKIDLATKFQNDRIAYTNGKTEFIVRITREAKAFYELDSK
ncbi:MAG: GrpB family protein [Calditrichaeota bacterium]|nr:MAG: GrpB family protein [Calditrichota bacterium]